MTSTTDAGCAGCGATTLPLNSEDRCTTCTTLEMVRAPASGKYANGNGSATAREQTVMAESHNVARAAQELPKVNELLDELLGFVRRFVSMAEAEAVAVALWVVHTHTFSAAAATPYLSVTSAEKESGKTRLLEVLELLVARPWLTGRATAAVLPRKIDADRPSLLLDESDTAFKGDKDYAEALRGVLNSGHRRGGKTTVCVGQGADIGFKDFSTFCPKAIAGIGGLPDTVQSRSIPIRLKRRAPGEQVERFRYEDAKAEADPLRAALELVADGVGARLVIVRPELPEELGDRAQDCWEPLLALAKLAGDDWPTLARDAAVRLSADVNAEDDSLGVRLLADIRVVFADSDRLASTDILAGLHALDEAPWGDWYGKPLTARALGRLLRPYGIQSRAVRFHNGTNAKGFLRTQFEDSWTRYTPSSPLGKGHTVTTRSGSGIEPNSDRSQETLVTDSESAATPHHDCDVTDVTDTEPGDRA